MLHVQQFGWETRGERQERPRGAAGTIYPAPTGERKPKDRSEDRPLQKKKGDRGANCSSRRR